MMAISLAYGGGGYGTSIKISISSHDFSSEMVDMASLMRSSYETKSFYQHRHTCFGNVKCFILQCESYNF